MAGIQKIEMKDAEMHYDRGYEIGHLIGRYHNDNILHLDLKLEHCLYNPESPRHERVAIVDLEDVFCLFRKPIPEECAQTISVLFRELNSISWNGFKIGYIEVLNDFAIEVLFIFDGERMYIESGNVYMEKARTFSKKGIIDDAIKFYDKALELFLKVPQRKEATESIIKIHAIKGDLFRKKKDYKKAKVFYELVVSKLTGTSGGSHYKFMLSASLVNLGIVNVELGYHLEGKKDLLRAKGLIEELIEKGQIEYRNVLRVVEYNLESLSKKNY